MILFVTGFQRSGTTVLVDAITGAAGGRALTTGHLAAVLPGRRGRLLTQVLSSGVPVDRGVDERLVTADLPEEYAWFLFGQSLRARRGRPRSFRFRESQTSIVAELARTVAAGPDGPGAPDRPPVAVLKNPFDTGREDLLLRCFPEASAVVIRRSLFGIEASMRRSVPRYVVSDTYFRALMGNDPLARLTVRLLRRDRVRNLMLRLGCWRLRIAVVRLLPSLRRLPLDRVAFLSYDEMLADPVAGAGWASHLLDPDRLARDFEAAVFTGARRRPGDVAGPGPDWIGRLIDRAWARAWDRARERQRAAGVVPPR